MNEELQQRLSRVKLLALDVDGTLTDGGLIFEADGAEMKRFHTQDGLGIVLARDVGLETAILTGRDSAIVRYRAAELGIPRHLVLQGVHNKVEALRRIATMSNIQLDEMAFMGDDLNDLPAMNAVAAGLAPANAVPFVRAAAAWVSTRNGGEGAVREAIEQVLLARGLYEEAIRRYLEKLTPGQ